MTTHSESNELGITQSNFSLRHLVIQMVSNQTKTKAMTAKEIVDFTKTLYAEYSIWLNTPENDTCIPVSGLLPAKEVPTIEKPELTMEYDPKTAIKEDTITCCICGHTRKVLTVTHLEKHNMNPKEYRAFCGYKKDQPLMCHKTARFRKNSPLMVSKKTKILADNDNEEANVALLAEGFDPKDKENMVSN